MGVQSDVVREPFLNGCRLPNQLRVGPLLDRLCTCIYLNALLRQRRAASCPLSAIQNLPAQIRDPQYVIILPSQLLVRLSLTRDILGPFKYNSIEAA